MKDSLRCMLALTLFSVTSSPAWAQIVFGQIDNFQDGTLRNWSNGPNPDPVNIPNGGPGGLGDRFLEVASGTLGGGPRSIVFNRSQWTGNYLAAGVTAVEMDLANLGTSTLTMRFAMRSGQGTQTTPGYVSNTPLILPPDGVWRHVVFQLDAVHLTPINSPTPLPTFMASVAEARILDAASPSLIGDAGNFLFGVDNIHAFALAVPEPATWVLLGGSCAALVGTIVWHRRRNKHALDRVYDEDELFEE
jgi:hypothetical protein